VEAGLVSIRHLTQAQWAHLAHLELVAAEAEAIHLMVDLADLEQQSFHCQHLVTAML
jgi:dihydroorotase-like cyclic amidohydrolase